MFRSTCALLLFCVFSSPLPAQKTATWGAVGRTVHYEYRLMNPTSKAAEDIDVYLPLPHESPRQEIHYLHLSEYGKKRVFTDVHGQKLVHYSFERLDAGGWVDVGFLAGVTLRNLRWITPDEPVVPGGPVLTSEERARYLKSLPNYSMESPIIRNTARELTRDAGSDYDKLVRIHDHVISKIRYVRDDDWDPAAVILARGTGSCSEYNYVLSGLCRNAGLPTRYVGGSSNGFRPLPTTDTVYHRWTEVFLTGLGWFPVDCSRDANPIRGRRSHFGRVHTDVLVWCQQAGGGKDYLGWDYRAEYRLQGKDPGLADIHRTRWFSFQPGEHVDAARSWLQNGEGGRPEADLLECALLGWPEASTERQLELVEALAGTGRNICLRRVATLPETGELRATRVQELCASPKLATELLESSRQINKLCSWFKSNESRLVPSGNGKFRLNKTPLRKPTGTAALSTPADVWESLAREAMDQMTSSMPGSRGRSVAVMPVVDQTASSLEGSQQARIQQSLTRLISEKLQVRLVDERRFNDFLEAKGPGRGEFWAFTLAEEGRPGTVPPEPIKPDYILVPICITEVTEKSPETCRYQLDIKGLELKGNRTFGTRTRRQVPGDTPRDSRIDLSRIPSPRIIAGSEENHYRDPAALYRDGVFHLWFTVNQPRDDKKTLASFIGHSTSRDLVQWSPVKLITEEDATLNYSSPGNVIRCNGQWIICFQTYPTRGRGYTGDGTARLFVMRSKDLESWSEPELLRVKGPDVPREKMGRMIDPYLLEDKDEPGKWWCFYKQSGVSMSWTRDFKTWRYHGRTGSGENVSVLVKNDRYIIMHSPGADGMGLLASRDLEEFEEYVPGRIRLGFKKWPWAMQRLTAGTVLDLTEDPRVGKYLMFFHATQGKGPMEHLGVCSLGIAWSDDLKHWSWPGKE